MHAHVPHRPRYMVAAQPTHAMRLGGAVSGRLRTVVDDCTGCALTAGSNGRRCHFGRDCTGEKLWIDFVCVGVCLSGRAPGRLSVCPTEHLAVSASRVVHRFIYRLALVASSTLHGQGSLRRAAPHGSALWLPLRELCTHELAGLVARFGASQRHLRLRQRQLRDSRFHSSGPTRSVPNFIVVIAGVLRGRADSRHHLRCRRDVPIVHRCTLGVHFLQRQRHCRIHRHDALGARP